MQHIPKSVEKRAHELSALILRHQELYHEKDSPEISDEAYDSLVQEILSLKEKYPSLDVQYRVTDLIGGKPDDAFAKIKHKVQQWSFDNVFSDIELQEWEGRLYRFLEKEGRHASRLEYVCEHKIDGLKLILEYVDGKLTRASTRGDGVTGEDVTHTARVIHDIPEILKLPVTLIVVGESWLPQDEFERINKERKKQDKPLFANPRNAAAGSIRQLDAQITKSRRLAFFAYDVDYLDKKTFKGDLPKTQSEELSFLKRLGFTVNAHAAFCKTLHEVIYEYKKWAPKKHSMQYGMDGLVIKVNDITLQTILGHTAKSPRFGIAYKFPSEEATTIIEDIVLQVGRTGVVTPVAHLRPVRIAGSMVSRATLHNEDQIKRLDVRVGDTVILQKAGDVIPEILSVVYELRQKNSKPYQFPKRISECGGDGSIERIPGMSAYRCVAKDSAVLHRRKLYHFVSKQALNIDGVGPRIIDLFLEYNLINTASDLFTLTEGDLLGLPGFKEKSARNVIRAIDQARTVSLSRLLVALSIDHVGEETARIIAESFGNITRLQDASREELVGVFGVGEIVADSLRAWFKDQNHKKELEALLTHLTIESLESSKKDGVLKGKTIVFTGSLHSLTRSEAEDLARVNGAHVTSTVSKQTSFVVAGNDSGSKADKATRLGIPLLSEYEFQKIIQRKV